MKKTYAVLISLLMISVGLAAIPQQCLAQSISYSYFDKCRCYHEGNAGAICDKETAEMGLWTRYPGGSAGCIGITEMNPPHFNCKYVAVKVHVYGLASKGPHETLSLTYDWDEGEVTKTWFGTEINGWVDFYWTYSTEIKEIPRYQSMEARLNAPVCSCDNKLEIQTVFYIGSEPIDL